MADRDTLANGRRVWEGAGVVRRFPDWPEGAREVLLQEHADDASANGLLVVKARAVDAYLAKPVQQEELLETFYRVLAAGESR